jgi:sarcosine oxidase gamma subunit
MDEGPPQSAAIECAGLRVSCETHSQVAALRYFDATGEFAAAVLEVLGRPLPAPLQATMIADAAGELRFVLAWRSPSETLMLSREPATFASLEARLLTVNDGCLVEQTDGIWPVRVQGNRAVDLLLRLGSAASIPQPGAAHGLRLAELHVLAVCLQTEEYLLFVERVYVEHLMEWMRATVADF